MSTTPHNLLQMKIVQRSLSAFPHTKVNVAVAVGGRRQTVDLYKVYDDVIGGYMPSKIFVTGVHTAGRESVPELRFTYYVNATLPEHVRPFKDGGMYAFAIEARRDDVVEYDLNIRMFIDHVSKDGKVWYVFCFAHDVYDEVVIPDVEAEPVTPQYVGDKTKSIATVGQYVKLNPSYDITTPATEQIHGLVLVVEEVIDNGMFGCAQVRVADVGNSGIRVWTNSDDLVHA